MPDSSVYAEIDLSALRHNLSVVRRHAFGSRVMAVVKSQAYGHGGVGVAQALASGVDALAVARMEEGRLLREAGIDCPVVVLEGPVQQADLDLADRLGLELTIHHESQLNLLRAHRGGPLACWLKCDTGMHRLGFSLDHVGGAWSFLSETTSVEERGVITHLACADDPNDPMTEKQLERMRRACKGLEAEQSIANSAAIIAWPDSHADWVRPGLMLYGASPIIGRTAATLDLQPVMTLRAPLIATKTLAKGDPVGYGASWTAPEDMPLGVVGIGYGDGYPRHIGAGAGVLLAGRRVPIVGRVSMDMITIDLRGVDANVGDSVTLWGEGLPVEEVAEWAGTIPYTLFCGVTERVERRYRS